MRRPDERKRQQIIAIAAKLFASQPFHKVRLDDVAAAAAVGKGTLYIYFDSKEALYLSLIYEGFSELVTCLEGQLTDPKLSAWQRLERIVRQLVAFAFQHPQLSELMRTVPPPKAKALWRRKREELLSLIERAIRAGVEQGQFCDPRPHLTAMFIPAMVRSVMIHGARGADQAAITAQMLHLLRQGLVKDGAKKGTS